MTGSLWPAVVDALVDTLTAASITGDPVIFDGPPPADDASPRGIAVGMPSPTDVEEASGTVRQEWRDAGRWPDAGRSESGTIRCTAWAWTGDDWTFRALRSDVEALLSGIHAAVGATSVLGLEQVYDLRCMESVEWVQKQDTSGCTVEALFTVAYQARI